jgi:hypothetical protein
MVKFNKQDDKYNEGTTVTASVTRSAIIVEDSKGDSITLTGSTPITGEEQTLQVSGAHVEYVSSSSVKVDDAGMIRDYTLAFDVTAIGDKVEVLRTLAGTTGDDGQNATGGLKYTVETPGGATAVGSATLTSDASLSTDTYTVFDGQTKRFTLTVNVSAASATGAYYITLDEVAGSPVTNVETGAATVVITS